MHRHSSWRHRQQKGTAENWTITQHSNYRHPKCYISILINALNNWKSRVFRAHAVLGGQTITSLKASQDAPRLICLSRLVRYCKRSNKKLIVFGKGKEKQEGGKNLHCGQLWKWSKEERHDQDKRSPNRRKWIYPRPCIMTNLQENGILPCNTSESKISRALPMGIQLKIPKTLNIPLPFNCFFFLLSFFWIWIRRDARQQMNKFKETFSSPMSLYDCP